MATTGAADVDEHADSEKVSGGAALGVAEGVDGVVVAAPTHAVVRVNAAGVNVGDANVVP